MIFNLQAQIKHTKKKKTVLSTGFYGRILYPFKVFKKQVLSFFTHFLFLHLDVKTTKNTLDDKSALNSVNQL